MKTLANIVVVAFYATCIFQLVWLYGVVTKTGIVDLDLNGTRWMSVISIVLGCAVAAIMTYSWLRGRPYLVTWMHIGTGVAALSIALASTWLLLVFLDVRSQLLSLLLWGSAILWLIGALLMMRWVGNPARQASKKVRKE